MRLKTLTAAERQAIRDRARAAADAIEEAAAAWDQELPAAAEAALWKALEEARHARALADALERKERGS